MSDRVEFTRSTKDAIFHRASKPTGFPCCEKCGVMVKAGKFEIDHRIPDAQFKSRADKKANATVDGGWLLCLDCHGVKTAKVDIPGVAKASRLEAKRLGIYPKGRHRLQGRGFDKRSFNVQQQKG